MPENVLNGDRVEVKGEVNQNEEDNAEHDVHFEPIISLPLIEVSNNEEDEMEMIKLRAKLYRYDSSSNPAEWKERGTGEVKLLRHNVKNTVRVVMRRDKTLKICANHFVTPWMELKPNCGSDRAWVWSVLADFADEQLKPELLAIRFANAENALAWKEAFEKAKTIVSTECEIYAGKSNPEERQARSDSESSSDISYSDSSEQEEEGSSSKRTDVPQSDVQTGSTKKESPKDSEVEKGNKSTNEIIGQLEKLEVSSEAEEKK